MHPSSKRPRQRLFHVEFGLSPAVTLGPHINLWSIMMSTGEGMQTGRSVSVIGLGAMGSGIARTLIEAGCRVQVWNRSRDKVDAMASRGAIACNLPGEALGASEHVVVCLSGYSIWKNIIEDHGLQDEFNGRCIIQLTGGSIDEVREHASLMEAHGGRLADGAVMCFPAQLGTEDASLLMSGASDVLDECDPILRALAPGWTNLGEDISRPVILSRSLTAGIVTSLIGLLNGVAICRASGISLDAYMEHARKANAIVPDEHRRLIEAVRDHATEETQASIRTWAEAHQTICDVAGSLGTDLLLQDAVRAVFEKGQGMGLGEHDLSALVRVFESDLKV